MAGKKIGLILALDGEKEFIQAVQAAKKESQLFETQLKGLAEKFDGNANSLEYLQKKQELLTQQQAAYKRQLEASESGLEKANSNYRKQGKRLEELKKQLEEARNAQKQMEVAGETGSKAYDEQSKSVEKLEKAVENQTAARIKEAGSISDWNKKIYESERALDKSNKAIEDNEKYLKEAEAATDHCATSIDAMGKELKDTAEDIEDANKKTSVFGSVVKANLTSTAIISGVKKLGEAAKEAAEYVVDVGSSFEAAMSEVIAISGASGDEVEALTEKAKELGAETKFSASEAADALKYMSLAGWSTADMLSGIDGILSLAAASGMELASASDMVTDYLSAFNMEASEATKMADMLAYAQANSNTTAEQLGEAYGNSAAILNTAGQDIETVTALLEGMANQGLKGSEAGTALGSIMTQITQKMKDGKIAIGDTNIEVSDSEGNFRDLTDILIDVDSALEGMGTQQRSAALASTFNKTALSGLNLVLNEGIDKIADYEEELRNSSGVAKEMSDIMQDNLKGDLDEASSALEGLGIAAYEYIDGPVRGVVQGVTGIINGITDAITPQKTELETFVDEIKASNNEVQTMLDNAENTMSGATADVAELETYKQVLMELNEQESLTEFQKYQLASAVSALSGQIPGLAEAFDAETSSLNLTNEQLTEMFDNAQALVMQQALLEAQAQSMEALAQATINKAMADSAAETAQENLNKYLEENPDLAAAIAEGYGKETQELIDLNAELTRSKQAQDDATESEEKAAEQIEIQNKALAGLKEQYGIFTDSTEEAKTAIEETGKTAGDVAHTFDEYGNDITGMSEEQAAAVTEASQKIVDAYTDMRDGIADSIKGSMSLFDEFSGGAEISAGEINDNLESQITGIQQWSENMQTLAGQIGQGFSQELYDELAAMGPKQSATAVQALVDALNSESGEFEEVSKNWSELLVLQDNAEAIANATTAGKNLVGGYVSGMTEESEQVVNTTQEMAQAAVVAAENEVPNFQTAGSNASQAYTNALKAAVGKASQAAGDMARAARDALNAYQSSFYTIGFNLAAGASQGLIQGAPVVAEAARSVIRQAKQAAQQEAEEHSPSVVWRKEIGFNLSKGAALGILDGQKDVMAASRDMAKSALDATKAELGIHSPSKIFKEQVGAMITEGVAFGISSKASLAGKAAAKMSNKVYTKAVSWLAKYKKKQQASLDDEEYYWKQVLKHVKKGTTAYNNAAKKLGGAIFDGTGLSSSSATKAAKKIADNFGVSKYTKSGKKKTKKSDDTYYSEIYSAAEKYLSNMQVLNDWSLEQELAYWNGVKEQLKYGTQAWYDATKQINSLQADITAAEAKAAEAQAKAAEEKVKTHANVQKDILDKYKVYYKVSAKAEMDYWNIARQQFKKGTDERIEADQNYLKACQEYYDQRKELDEDYAESSKDINEDLTKNIQDLQDAYHDAVQSRKQDILSSMNLFESWDASGYDSDTLLYNLKTQVAGLALWEQQLEELGKKGLSEALMEELAAMGPDAAANIYSLNQMTAEQLDEYNKLWEQKNALAHSQALKDNEDLLKETNSEIINLRTEAQAELNALNADYRAALQELNTGISSELRNLVNKAGSIGEEAVSSLIAGIGKEATSVDAYNSTTQVVNQISSQLGTLKQEGKTIGASALDGLLAAMQDNDKINSASKQVIQSIKRAMEEEAEIHSPARLFRRETGPQIPAGVALGMEDGTKVAVRSAQEMMQDTLAATQEEMRRQQAALQEQAGTLSYAGIAKLNRLTEQYPQQAPVVNVDNSGLMGLMERLITNMDTRLERLENMQVVIDDTVIGVLQPKLSRENAMATVRANRGRRR